MEIPEGVKKDYPELAMGIILEHPVDNQILLLQSTKWENQYRVPRGHLLLGESLEESVKRIVRTELGVECVNVTLISYQESIFSDEFVDPHHFLFMNFYAKAKPFDNLATNSSIWVTPYQSLDYTLNRSTRQLLESYLEHIRN
ncbi:MAG: NUDIX domain-containing protein [Patescibacteria group bacterium]|nr:NUDIX domain-containing protein [Patescibacteria group bacterium]